MVAGGGALGPEIWERFVERAGGPQARIIVIPTAGTEEEFPDDWSGLGALRGAGAAEVRILHTRDRAEADTPAFAEQIRWASGVWIPGGRQWRLVDSYLHTRVHDELWALLHRDGIIGGTSAGASIQADFLVRGDPASNQIMISEGYLEGFGFLTGTAIDQHLLARAREADLWEVLARSPGLIGIGVDEGTALLIEGDRGEVLGSSQVLFYASGDPLRNPVALGPGATVDLAEWRARSGNDADRDLP
jgi:cyanophycinase